jgi:hypothetical protein
MKKTFGVVLVAFMCFVVTGTVMAARPAWIPGVLSQTEDLIGVRYRAFHTDGTEVFLGIPPAFTDRTNGNVTWVVMPGTNEITFTYDAVYDKLITKVAGGALIKFLDVSTKITDPPKEFTLNDLNFLQITIINGGRNTTVNFNDVVLTSNAFPGGVSLGSFGGNGRYDWSVKDDPGSPLMLSDGFTITGKIILRGDFGTDAEASKLEIKAGHWSPNSPPDCSQAYPSIAKLWPPNHKFRDVNVRGVTDPDDDPITIRIDSIFQDEEVLAKGSGHTSIDGKGVGTRTAKVRAERQGSGNGRVYHIGFTADDGNGGTCSGEVLVGVPHSKGKKGAPIDDGALYDSTGP